jgi:uncharacterized protein YndB with AHSA1/START domain
MSRVNVSATIRRPIEDVFAVLTDVEQTASWFPADIEEHWTSPPPHGVGSTRHAVVRVGGRTSENDAVVTAYEPPRLAAMRGITPGAEFEAELRFTPVDGGTRVDVEIDLATRGLRRLVLPVFASWYRRNWRAGLAALARRMEASER